MSHNQPTSGISQGQSLPIGTELEEFVIERVLGVGGFGITYLAKDSSLGRRVVIKENLPAQFCWRDTHSLTVSPRHTEGEDADNFSYSLESFRKEAATLAKLDHPGIVKVLRSFQANGTAYFVMPFVEGTTLDEVIRQRTSQNNPFTEAEIQDLLTKVLHALGHLHEREHGIYHRDIKPGNILMTKAGPVLIDFGAARQLLSERSLTVIESAGYTPFEQLQARGKVGPWSDLYALGGTLYKAITGETPAKANDRAFDDPVVPLTQRSELRGHFTERLLESIDKAMAPNAANRFQSCGEWKTWACFADRPISFSGRVTLPAPVIPAAAPSSAPDSSAANDLATVVRRTRSADSNTQPGLPAVSKAVAPTPSPAPARFLLITAAIAVVVAVNVTMPANVNASLLITAVIAVVVAIALNLRPRWQMAAEAKRKRMAALEEEQKQKDAALVATLCGAGKIAPFTNSQGMKFVPVEITGGPTGGKLVLFSIWDTRVRDYAAYAKANGVNPEPPNFAQTEDHPVVNVCWDDAKSFCAWLTTSERVAEKLPAGWAYRLPSDHEWSCAIGIGGQEDASASPRRKDKIVEGYPWGDAMPPPQGFGNYASSLTVDNFEHTSPVGIFPADRNGLYDLSGNVWQWCEDWYDTSLGVRVLRGAAWYFITELGLRSSYRNYGDSRRRTNYYGFRVVLVVTGG